MGETLKPHTVKWGEATDKEIMEIRQEAGPFDVSISHVVRVSVHKFHAAFCIVSTVKEDGHPAQELQGVMEYDASSPEMRQEKPGPIRVPRPKRIHDRPGMFNTGYPLYWHEFMAVTQRGSR